MSGGNGSIELAIERLEGKVLVLERDMSIYLAEVREVKTLIRETFDAIAADNVRTTETTHEIITDIMGGLDKRVSVVENTIMRIAAKLGV